MKPTRIALADDHAVVRAGYRRFLESEADFQVCAEYADGATAYNGLVALDQTGQGADLLILDLSMPGRGGMATLQRLQQRLPGLRVLIFSMHEGEGLVTQALRSGARGFLSKAGDPDELIAAVRQVMRGDFVLPKDFAHLADALQAPERKTSSFPHESLSPKELEIFRMLADGVSVDEVAQRLNLSSKTASNYQTIIRKKTGLSSAVEMHRYAVSHRFL